MCIRDRPVTGESKKCGGVCLMYAIIQTGGKQYKVTEGSVLKIEKMNAEPGDRLTLDQVLMAVSYTHLSVKVDHQGSQQSIFTRTN